MQETRASSSSNSQISKISLTTLLSMTENSVVTLNRTDTTLDLSQKAREDKEHVVWENLFITINCAFENIKNYGSSFVSKP